LVDKVIALIRLTSVYFDTAPPNPARPISKKDIGIDCFDFDEIEGKERERMSPN
jgi:hypothetical protein